MADDSNGTIVAWSPIFATLSISIFQSTIFYLFFLFQRFKDKKKGSLSLYEPRQHILSHRSPAPFGANWLMDAWNVSEEELLRCVGLDAFMYLRFLRLCARVAAVGTFFSLVLIPLYVTGGNRGDASEQFNKLTLARVESGSNRLWVATFFWWIFVAFVLNEFWKEWQLFAKNRYNFLANGAPDTPQDFRYSIRVEQLPPKLRSNKALLTYFERIFPQKVRNATVFLHIPELEELCALRKTAILNVEKAVAFTVTKPDKPRPQTKIGGSYCGEGNMVDTIDHFTSEINRLNHEIDAVRAEILKNQTLSNDHETMLDKDKEPLLQKAESSVEETKVSLASSTGIVTFSSLCAKQSAVQCEISGKPDEVNVFPTVDPSNILWNNMTFLLTRQHLRKAKVAAVWIVGIFFWAFPITFVNSISNLNSVLTTLGLKELNQNSFWYGLITGLLPVVLLSLLMELLYKAIETAASHYIRMKSSSEVDVYALWWHQLFQVANLWLLLIGGSLANQLRPFVNNPVSIVEILAGALPGASVFFVNMITVGGLGSFGLELSMIARYGLALVKSLIQPDSLRTQRTLDNEKEPPPIEWGKVIPPRIFVFMVMITYMSIAPIMEVFAFVYFSGSYLVWKHQCLHVYAQGESGGVITWQSIFPFLMACLYMAELIFFSYMTIKQVRYENKQNVCIQF